MGREQYDARTPEKYTEMWEQPYGNAEGRRFVDGSGTTVTAEPFTTGADRGVQDHLKYSAFSKKRFPVPMRGSVMVEATMLAHTPGTEHAHTMTGQGQMGLSVGHPDGVELRVGGVGVPLRPNAAGERLGDVAALRPRDGAGQEAAPVQADCNYTVITLDCNYTVRETRYLASHFSDKNKRRNPKASTWLL